jgi:hypothetical protein
MAPPGTRTGGPTMGISLFAPSGAAQFGSPRGGRRTRLSEAPLLFMVVSWMSRSKLFLIILVARRCQCVAVAVF